MGGTGRDGRGHAGWAGPSVLSTARSPTRRSIHRSLLCSPVPGTIPGSRLASCFSWPLAATVATVATTTSRPTSAALGAVVSTSPEPMTSQGQSAAAGSAAWSAVFRHVRYENLVAGVSGGVLSNLALHPLDLVKIRFAGKSPPTPRATAPSRH